MSAATAVIRRFVLSRTAAVSCDKKLGTAIVSPQLSTKKQPYASSSSSGRHHQIRWCHSGCGLYLASPSWRRLVHGPRQSSHLQTRRNVFHSTTSRFHPQKKDQPGLFTISGLVQPQDFMKLAHEAMRTSDQLRASIRLEPVISVSQARDILYTLDQISKTVCNVIDAAELCRSAHASERWRHEAQRTFTLLQDYIATLNADTSLYESLRLVTQATHIFEQLTEEEQRFAILLQREFELDGIHLPDEQRQHAQQLHSHVIQLETMFANNITNAQKSFIVDADLVEEVIPRPVLQANGAVYHENKVQLMTDTPISHSLTSYAPNAELRRQVYMESMTACSENLDVLEALQQRRHELSTILGFSSYADRFLQDKMAQNQENVSGFLQALQQQIAPIYRRELQLLADTKQRFEGTDQLQPWDIKFYVKYLKAQAGVDPNLLIPYFSLENCLSAMQILVFELFGIQMQEQQDLSDAERWDVAEGTSARNLSKEERIRKFVFHEEKTGRSLGTMYLDLYPRKGKYTHAAHFTVRCGCLVNGPGSDYQLPIVALVCNMNSGAASFSSHQEVETLFHEFGHALHSLLSRTNFQHMSGTRAAMDFVETPSHWMEHYVWDEQFLPVLAKTVHGEPIPERLIHGLRQSHQLFRCLELQNQIVLASFDQRIFGNPNEASFKASTADLWADLHKQYQIPFAEGTHWYSNVGHFVTYGAGYYGYLYSQVFASDIWHELFQHRCLERSSGERMWKQLLMHGGARDANVMLRDLLGRDPAVDTFWDSLRV